MMTKINDLVTKIATLKEEYQKEASKVLYELADEVFNKTYDIIGITWKQYTPYFNDGDDCEFTVYLSDYRHDEHLLVMDEGDRVPLCDHPNPELFEYEMEVINDEFKAFCKFCVDNEEILESIFGNHVRVTLLKGQKEAVVKEYRYHS